MNRLINQPIGKFIRRKLEFKILLIIKIEDYIIFRQAEIDKICPTVYNLVPFLIQIQTGFIIFSNQVLIMDHQNSSRQRLEQSVRAFRTERREAVQQIDQENRHRTNQPQGRVGMIEQENFQTPRNNRSQVNQDLPTFRPGAFQTPAREALQPRQNNQMRPIQRFEEGTENRKSLDERIQERRPNSHNKPEGSQFARRQELRGVIQESQQSNDQVRAPHQDREIQNVQNQRQIPENNEAHNIADQPDQNNNSGNQLSQPLSSPSQMDQQRTSEFQNVENATSSIPNPQNCQQQGELEQFQDLSEAPYQVQTPYQVEDEGQNQQWLESQPLVFLNVDHMRRELQRNPTFKAEFDKMWSQIDPKYFQLPQILPQMPANISNQELIMTHPWSLLNPNKIQLQNQPKTLQRIAYDQLIGTYFALLNMKHQLVKKEQIYIPQFEQKSGINVDSKEVYDPFGKRQQNGSIGRLPQNYIREPDWDEHKKEMTAIEEKEMKIALEKLQNHQPYRRSMPIILEQRKESAERQKRMIEKKKILAKILRNRSSSKKKTIPSSNSQVSCSEFSVTRSKSTNDSSFVSSVSPHSSNSANARQKIGKKFEKLNPLVSEFKIQKYDKPFSKKYAIRVDSYEESAWKWWLYRMKNGIKGKYTGVVEFERFESTFHTQKSLIDDMLQKNETVRQLLDDPRMTGSVCLQHWAQMGPEHDGDLTGLVVLPLRLKLPEGCVYSYEGYLRGCVYGLQIQNEFAKIEFNQGIQLELKNESQRDWRKKFHMQRNRVWFGDDILRKFAKVIFFKPTNSEVSIEGEPEHLRMTVNDSKRKDVCRQRKSDHHCTGPENYQIYKTVSWIENPNYKKMSLRGKLQILAICLAFILFGAVFCYCFPQIKK